MGSNGETSRGPTLKSVRWIKTSMALQKELLACNGDPDCTEKVNMKLVELSKEEPIPIDYENMLKSAEITKDFNKKLEALTEEFKACGCDIDCINIVNKKLGALQKEYAERNAPIVEQTVPGVPITVSVSHLYEETHVEPHYSRDRCIGEYVSLHFSIEYDIREEGDLEYSYDFSRFRITVPAKKLRMRPNVGGYPGPQYFKIKRCSGYFQSVVDYDGRIERTNITRCLGITPCPVYGTLGKHANGLWNTFEISISCDPIAPVAKYFGFSPVQCFKVLDQKNNEHILGTEGDLAIPSGNRKFKATTEFPFSQEILKDAVNRGEFQKTFNWKYCPPENISDNGGRSSYTNIVTLSIDFKPPCWRVRRRLAFEERVKQTFIEVNPANYTSTKKYRDAVFEKVYGTDTNSSETTIDNKGKKPHAPMATYELNGHCHIGPGDVSDNPEYKEDWEKFYTGLYNADVPEGAFLDWVKETYYAQQDEPDIIWDSALAHEQEHLRVCKELQRNGRSFSEYLENPKNYQVSELNAYSASIKALKEWINKNCK